MNKCRRSITLEDLGVVLDFIGSTAGVLAMFICPGAENLTLTLNLALTLTLNLNPKPKPEPEPEPEP